MSLKRLLPSPGEGVTLWFCNNALWCRASIEAQTTVLRYGHRQCVTSKQSTLIVFHQEEAETYP
jgi:hypothetical protein